MEQKSKLALLEENHDQIIDSFDCNKKDLHWALDNFFSGWLSNPFQVDYSKEDKQNHFEFYLALKKQVELMEYMPTATKRLREIKVADAKAKYSSLKIKLRATDRKMSNN